MPATQGLGNYGTDPFGYTGGSLLTPWTQQFKAPAVTFSGGGHRAPQMDAFSYGNINYNYRAPGAYGGYQEFANPQDFSYGDFQAQQPFVGPTAADLARDPSYAFRLNQGTQALEHSAAARGLLRSGATAKGLMDYGQQAASQEYGNVYARKAGEYDRAYANALQGYQTNRGNAAENYDRNLAADFQTHQANQQNALDAYRASSDVSLRGGELGYNITTGLYDRNRANARDMYNSQMQIAQQKASAAAANASAGNAASSQAYNRALQEYQMAYGMFQNNQNTQWNRLTGLANMGAGAAGQQGAYGGAYAGNVGNAYGNYGTNAGNLYTQQGNANAAGQMGSANAWGGALNNLGNLAGGYAAYYAPQPQQARAPAYPPFQQPYGGMGTPVYGRP